MSEQGDVDRFGGASTEALATHFAPAARATREEVARSARELRAEDLLSIVLDAAGVHAVVLNSQRQVLFANAAFRTLVGAPDQQTVRGYRYGETLDCVNARANPAGCGTCEACANCGALRVVLDSQRLDAPSSGECSLQRRRPGDGVEALEFAVDAVPIRVAGRRLTVMTMRDISAEKRREALERVFFHDVLNTVTALDGYAKLLAEGTMEERARERITFLSARLRREVEDQRALLAAERGTLRPRVEQVAPGEVLAALEQIFAGLAAAAGKTLELSTAGPGRLLHTDPSLLLRVLSNMVKNALEACERGDTIRIGARVEAGHCTFRVVNPGRIAPEVAAQIFQRSFSTKGEPGHGLGTYSMKLFGERYLGGRVDFHSAGGETTFFIELPLEPLGGRAAAGHGVV